MRTTILETQDAMCTDMNLLQIVIERYRTIFPQLPSQSSLSIRVDRVDFDQLCTGL